MFKASIHFAILLFVGSIAYGRPSVPPKLESFEFQSPGNPEIIVFYSLPAKVSRKTRLLMVIAGQGRNADEYLRSWVDWAARHNYVVLAPHFDAKNWPGSLGYNSGNIATGKDDQPNSPNPRPKWAFTVIEQLFDETRARFSIKRDEYDIFGHSAGGQFVHRFILYYPENRVRVAIAANPGFYTLPDTATSFPYGVKDSPVAISEKRLRDWTNRKVIIMRGTADIERNGTLRQTPEADAQGRNRFERAAFMYSSIKKVNARTKWNLIDVPGVAHDQKGMAVGAQRELEARK